jgi:hypothetical protein
MRHALVSLIAASAAAAVSVSALAQETTTPEMTPPEATLPAPPPTIEPAQPATPALPAEPAPEVVPSPVQVPAAAEVVPTPVPVPEPVAEPAPPPPPPPTDPTTIRALHLLESLCKPMVQGADVDALTKSLGFRKKRDVFVLAQAKPVSFTVTPSASNRNVCLLEIDHAIGGDQPLTVGVHDWAIARGYTLYRNDEFTTDLKRHTRSWELVTEGKTEALVLVTAKKPDGSPVSRNADRTTLMYSVR